MNGHLCLSGILVYPAVLESLIPVAKTTLPHTPGKPGTDGRRLDPFIQKNFFRAMTVGQPIKKLVKSPAHAWLLGDFVDECVGRNGGEDCVHFCYAKGAGYSHWGRSNCRINRKNRF